MSDAYPSATNKEGKVNTWTYEGSKKCGPFT